MAGDWRVRIELADEDTRKHFAELLEAGLSPEGTERAAALRGGHLTVSGDDADLFVYADTATSASHAHEVVLAELAHHAIAATTSRVEQWLADEERWDNEPPGETWEEEVASQGYAPWEVRVDCGSRQEAGALAERLEAEGYDAIRRWSHLIIGTADREQADALAARLNGDVAPGGAVVWEGAIDSHVVRPFAFFG